MTLGKRTPLHAWLIGIGVISVALGMGAVAADKPPTATDSMNLMMKADTDKDGTLTRAETAKFDSALAAGFDKADADKDGKLTLKEFETLLASTKKK